MTQAVTDRTGYTCLYAVYSTATYACSFFVFSLCGVQNTDTEEYFLNLPIVLLFCFTYVTAKKISTIPPQSHNVPTILFIYFFFTIFHKLVFNVICRSNPHAESANFQKLFISDFCFYAKLDKDM